VILRFAGFGGQGVVLSGFIVGKAAVLDGKNAIHTQSYGSASRGGLTRSDVTIEEGEIYDLVPDELDLLVAMSQQSYNAFRKLLVPGGRLFYEADLVQLGSDAPPDRWGVQATDLAYKQLGRKVIANILMLGFLNRIARVVSPGSLERTIRETVPPGTETLNISALELGAELAAGANGGGGA
jgi:2-oxoglutarate ferredoxin oxidoreductase subunit gamma